MNHMSLEPGCPWIDIDEEHEEEIRYCAFDSLAYRVSEMLIVRPTKRTVDYIAIMNVDEYLKITFENEEQYVFDTIKNQIDEQLKLLK